MTARIGVVSSFTSPVPVAQVQPKYNVAPSSRILSQYSRSAVR